MYFPNSLAQHSLINLYCLASSKSLLYACLECEILSNNMHSKWRKQSWHYCLTCTHTLLLLQAAMAAVCPVNSSSSWMNVTVDDPVELYIRPWLWGWGRCASVIKRGYTPMATNVVCVQACQDTVWDCLPLSQGQHTLGTANKTPTSFWGVSLFLL